MPEPTEVVVRGDPLDVFERLRTTHIGDTIKSIEFDYQTSEIVAKIIKNGARPVLVLDDDEAYVHHHLHRLGASSLFGHIEDGISAIVILQDFVQREFGKEKYQKYEKKLNEYFSHFCDGQWGTTEDIMSQVRPHLDIMRPKDDSRLH